MSSFHDLVAKMNPLLDEDFDPTEPQSPLDEKSRAVQDTLAAKIVEEMTEAAKKAAWDVYAEGLQRAHKDYPGQDFQEIEDLISDRLKKQGPVQLLPSSYL